MNHQIVVIVCTFGAALLSQSLTNAYIDGAPEEACDHMRPGHEVRDSIEAVKPLIEPQTGRPFYSIHVNQKTFNPGDELQVTILADQFYFEGFLIQARDVNNAVSDKGSVKKYGIFTELKNITKLLCNKQAVTHAVHEHLTNVTLKWTAPNETVSNIQFKATVVKGYTTFYLNVRSETLNFSSAIVHLPSCVLVTLMLCLTLGYWSY